MPKKIRPAKTLTLRTGEQRAAVASPLRMELLGLFVEREPLSVVQMAERVGRSATSIHYHVKILEKAGLLRRAGERRAGRRPEALFLPVAERFEMERSPDPAATVKTLSTAFRMAERDLEAALADPESRSSGPHRNVFGARIHCRLSRQELAELNRHLRGIEKMLTRAHRTHRPTDGDRFYSLTLAFLPIRNREVRS